MPKDECAFLNPQIQKYNHWPHFWTEIGAIFTSLLSLACDALDLCLLRSSLPSPCHFSALLPPSLPNFPPSAQLFIFSFYNSGSSSAVSLTVPPPHTLIHPPTHPSANPLTKGQEGPSLAQCLMGSDSSVFWDYARWKGGHSIVGGLLFDAATVCFWQDSCSKASRPPRARLKEGTWLPISSGVSAASTWGHRPSSSPANHVWFGFLEIPLFFFTFNKANFYKHVLESMQNQIYTADARTVIRMSP